MKLEVGKSYVNRMGVVVKIIEFDPDSGGPHEYLGDNYFWFLPDGKWSSADEESPGDLIAEAPEAAETCQFVPATDTDTQPDDGGPAFPVTPTDRSGQIEATQWGMSLREWYAGLALSGVLAVDPLDFKRVKEFAEFAFKQADEMIKASRK